MTTAGKIAQLALVVGVLVWAAGAHAQPADLQAAAAAFGEAQRAQLRGDYGQAADLFEIADRSAPSPAALRSAIRNHRMADRPARAATLAAEAQSRYPDDPETSALAAETLAALAPGLGHVRVTCSTHCSLALDARAVLDHPVEAYEVYVEPGEHTLVASWHGAGTERRDIEAHAGDDTTFELEAPAVPEVVVSDPEPESHAAPPPAAPPPSARGLHPAVFGTLTGVALVGLALTIGSGIDTLNAAAEYRDDPTHGRYDDGIGRELRTNALMSVTAAVAIAALVTVFFTDWDDITPGPDESITLRPSFYASPDGGGAVLLGRFAL